MYELSIVVPTFNEKENIKPVFNALSESLNGFVWELIFVDDNSNDGTLNELHKLSLEHSHVRFIHRVNQRGLSTACIEGMMSSVAPYVGVMDADLQHDEKIIPEMLSQLKNGYDLAIGSRYVREGSMGTMPSHRVKISQLASKLSYLVVPKNIKDPMSGFFLMKRDLLNSIVDSLTTTGYKLLLDIVVNAGNNACIVEVPYIMRHRQFGESKLDTFVVLEYLQFLIEKRIGKLIPARFVMFVLVGFTGIFVHLFALSIFFKLFQMEFILSQALATLTAMVSNYQINNLTTYRDMRLRGVKFFYGLLNFCVACSLGALINVMVADSLKEINFEWWLAGLLGTIVGAIWNYSLTRFYTWRSFDK